MIIRTRTFSGNGRLRQLDIAKRGTDAEIRAVAGAATEALSQKPVQDPLHMENKENTPRRTQLEDDLTWGSSMEPSFPPATRAASVFSGDIIAKHDRRRRARLKACVTGECSTKQYFSWPVVTGFCGQRGAHSRGIGRAVEG